MTSSRRHDHYDRANYHMHMNAVYRVGDTCFVDYLKRVRNDYRSTTPDLAMHLYRTDYANFREAQHTQHLFRYSRMFIALDTSMTLRPEAKKEDWPGTYFMIQDRHYARFGKNIIVTKQKEKLVEIVNQDIDDDDEKENPGSDDNENIVRNEVKKHI